MIHAGANIAFIILIVAYFLAFLRLLRGPSLPDRVVSLDLIVSLTMGIILIISILSEHKVFVDIVMIISLVMFLGTVAIALYLNKARKE